MAAIIFPDPVLVVLRTMGLIRINIEPSQGDNHKIASIPFCKLHRRHAPCPLLTMEAGHRLQQFPCRTGVERSPVAADVKENGILFSNILRQVPPKERAGFNDG